MIEFPVFDHKRNTERIVRIDSEDVLKIINRKWSLAPRGADKFYASSNTHGKHTYMHHLILPPHDGLIVDHINGDGLDNRKSNLRLAKHFQNLHNTKPKNGRRFKGVYLRKRLANGKRPWTAMIQVNNSVRRLGTFATELEAAKAYDEAAKMLCGEFAVLNLPEGA